MYQSDNFHVNYIKKVGSLYVYGGGSLKNPFCQCKDALKISKLINTQFFSLLLWWVLWWIMAALACPVVMSTVSVRSLDSDPLIADRQHRCGKIWFELNHHVIREMVFDTLLDQNWINNESLDKVTGGPSPINFLDTTLLHILDVKVDLNNGDQFCTCFPRFSVVFEIFLLLLVYTLSSYRCRSIFSADIFYRIFYWRRPFDSSHRMDI